MASIQQVISNLPPDTATKLIEALQTPGETKDRIVEAIRNFEISDATDAVKNFLEEKKEEFTDPANIISLAGDRVIQESGLPFSMSDVQQFAGGDSTGIMSQVGDTLLSGAGLPITTADIGSVISAGKQGGISDALGAGTDIALDAIKNFGVQEGIRRAINAGVPITTIVMLADAPVIGPEIRKFGGEFRNLGSDIFTAKYSPTTILGLNEPLGRAFNYGLDVIGLGRREEEEEEDEDPVVTTTPGPVVSGPAGRVVDPGAVSQTFGGRGGADRGGDVVIGGGGADASQPDFGRGSFSGNPFIGSTTGTTRGSFSGNPFLAEGGLATIPRYLKGR